MFGIDDFLIGLAIAGAASAASAGVGAVGASNAAAAQKASADQATALQRDIFTQQQANYNQQRDDMMPWLSSGRTTLAQLMRQMQGGGFDTQLDPSQLANDPGYQFRMAEGQKALERSASARGMLNSGSALKSLARYSQGLASDEYQNAWNRDQTLNSNSFNRLASLAGVGQTAAQNLGNLSAQNSAQMGQYAGQMSNLYGALGNANAAGAMGTANAVSGGLGALGNFGMLGGMYAGSRGNSIPTQGGSGYGPGLGYGGFSNGYVPSFGLGLNYGGG